MKAWLNGEFVDWNQTDVSLLSHSFGRGSAIFEVLDIVPTESGPAYFGLAEHVERFFNSALLTGMQLPLDAHELSRELIRSAAENKVRNGACKFFAYYGGIEMRPVPSDPKVDIAIFCIDYDLFNVKQEDISAPVSVGIASLRKLDPATVPVQAKVAGNYVNPFLAKVEVMKRGYEDVIMLDTHGFVAEGATSNVFFVDNGQILTPPLVNALPGITRMAVMEVLAEMGHTVNEKNLRPDDIGCVDEAFYTSSLAKIQPIRSIEGNPLGAACPGPVTRALQEKMAGVYAGTTPKFMKWLTPIETSPSR